MSFVSRLLFVSMSVNCVDSQNLLVNNHVLIEYSAEVFGFFL